MAYSKLLHNQLFAGISKTNFTAMLACLGAYERNYRKQETIVHQGDGIDFVGIVVSGGVHIIKLDANGNEIILAQVGEGDLFAEVFACAGLSHSPVSIVTATDSVILFFNYAKLITSCSSACGFHQQLIANMLRILAQKSLYLNRRIDILSKRTLRDKIVTYFDYERCGMQTFTIGLNREALANFLCADRSALSNELSKMKKEGYIDYHKNTFKILL